MGMLARYRTLDGIKVVDATKSRQIKILEKDVKKRGMKNPTSCAVAEACKRAFGVAEARVYLTRTFLKLGNKWVRYMTPSSVKADIISFDRGGTFSPATHTLGKVPPAARQGAQKNKGRKDPKGTKRRVRKYHVTLGIRERAPNV